MPSRELAVILTGDSRDLERALNRSGNASKGFSSSLGGVAKGGAIAAGALGVAGLAGVLKVGFSEFSQHAKVAAQTEAVLKSTGGTANVTAKQVDTLATALMKKSGVDDEAIAAGENLLLTFTKIHNEAGKGNDIFNQATKATLDLSVSMKKDMASSAILVGKALNDPLTGLKNLIRVGVTFSDEQKKAIKALVDTGGAAKQAAKDQAAAAREVKAATGAVATAQAAVEAATRRVETAQIAEQTAARGVVTAQDALAASSERIRDAKEKVTQASQHLKDAQTSEQDSIQKVKDAQDALKDAQVNVKATQEALTAAREEATRKLDDMRDANRDAALGEEAAQLRLERSQERLDKVMKDSTSTDLDKREAVLDVAEATAGVSDAHERATRAAEDMASADAAGVDGSKEVISAKDAITQAQDREEKLTRAVILAQRDQKKSSREIADAARSLADAQDSVKDAQLKSIRAQQDLGAAQQRAARAAGDVARAQGEVGTAADAADAAQRRLALAHDAAAAAQEKSKNAVASASDLLKAQKIILAELSKEFGGSAAAAGETLPGQLNILKETFNNLAGDLAAKLEPHLMAATKWMNENLPLAAAKVQTLITGLSGFWRRHGETIKEVVGKIAGLIKDLTVQVGNFVKFFDDLVHGKWGEAWKDAKDIVETFFRLFKGIAELHIDLIKGVFGGLFTKVSNVVGDVVSAFKALPNSIWQAILGEKEKLVGKLTSFGGALKDAILAGFAGFGDLLAKIIKYPINKLIDLINGMKIPAIHVSLGPFGSFDSPEIDPIPEIPKLDTGGLILKTGLAVVDRGETFSGVGANRRGGGDTHLHIGTVIGTSLDQATDEIYRALLRKQKVNGTLGFA